MYHNFNEFLKHETLKLKLIHQRSLTKISSSDNVRNKVEQLHFAVSLIRQYQQQNTNKNSKQKTRMQKIQLQRNTKTKKQKK